MKHSGPSAGKSAGPGTIPAGSSIGRRRRARKDGGRVSEFPWSTHAFGGRTVMDRDGHQFSLTRSVQRPANERIALPPNLNVYERFATKVAIAVLK